MFFPGVPISHLRLSREYPSRPEIPIEARNDGPDFFAPSRDWSNWIVETFVADTGAFYNPDHQHLLFAHIGVLWTNVYNRRQMLTVLGEAEMPNPRGGKWQVARQKYQLSEWFGSVPDFIITLSGEKLSQASERTICAVIEHELYHCAHAQTPFGAPRFHDDGSPIFAIKGHDIEEFVGVVARWGMRPELKLLLEQANQQPKVPDEVIEGVCGTCRKLAA